jgi:hypothetical protein
MVRLGRSYPVQSAFTPNPQDIDVFFQAAGAGNSAVNVSGGTQNITWTHTATGPVLAYVNAGTHTSLSITVSYGGVSMPQLGTSVVYINSGGTIYTLAVFGLLTPASGSQTVSATATGATNARIIGDSVSYSNVSRFGTVVTTSGSGTSLTQSVSSTPGQMVSQAFGAGNTTTTLSAYNQTSRFSGNQGGLVPLQIGDAPGAASTSFSATLSTSAAWAGIAVPLISV